MCCVSATVLVEMQCRIVRLIVLDMSVCNRHQGVLLVFLHALAEEKRKDLGWLPKLLRGTSDPSWEAVSVDH